MNGVKPKIKQAVCLVIICAFVFQIIIILTLTNASDNRESLDLWIGNYKFSEVSGEPIMVMDYEIDIYQEDGKYFADIYQDGQTTMVRVRARVYGNEEWISMVFEEYLPDHSIGLNCEGESVLLSFRSDNENICTYWGSIEPMLYDNESSGGVYFEKSN